MYALPYKSDLCSLVLLAIFSTAVLGPSGASPNTSLNVASKFLPVVAIRSSIAVLAIPDALPPLAAEASNKDCAAIPASASIPSSPAFLIDAKALSISPPVWNAVLIILAASLDIFKPLDIMLKSDCLT